MQQLRCLEIPRQTRNHQHPGESKCHVCSIYLIVSGSGIDVMWENSISISFFYFFFVFFLFLFSIFSIFFYFFILRLQILSLQKNLKEVTSSVRNLESLLLTGCFNLSDDRLISAFNCRELSSLTHLDLSMCKKVSCHFSERVFSFSFHFFIFISFLSFLFHYFEFSYQITDDSVSKIAQSLVNLEKLDLAGCANISNSSLAHIERGLKRLKWLNLRSCRNITDSGIARLCGQTEESKLMEVGEEGERWRGVQSLGFLSLQDCQKLTDDSLKYISAGLKSLESINLSFCASLTEFGMKHLSTMVGDSLKEINLRSCDVTDLALRYLSEGGLTLHVLDISFCDRVRDDGLAYLSQGLPQLRSLSLNSIPCTDSGLLKLSQTLTDLNTLNVGQCFNITDRGIDAILNNCSHLSHLDIYGCSRISNQMIQRLEQLNLTLTRDLWQVGTESRSQKKQIQPQLQFTYLTNLNDFSLQPFSFQPCLL